MPISDGLIVFLIYQKLGKIDCGTSGERGCSTSATTVARKTIKNSKSEGFLVES
jgi:hypothetical protein